MYFITYEGATVRIIASRVKQSEMLTQPLLGYGKTGSNNWPIELL